MATFYTAETDWNIASIADKEEASTEVTVTGVTLGDIAYVSCSLDAEDLEMSAQVTAADKVTISVSNVTTGGIDILTPKFRIFVVSLSGQHIT